MKKLMLAMLLFSTSAFGSGKLQLQTNVTDGNVRPQVGLAVWQPLMRNVALNSWTGYGSRPFEDKDSTHWLVLKNELQVGVGKAWTVAPGFEWQEDFTAQESRNKFYVSLSYKLW